ncbi:hypothetical protein EDB81DRAFT_238671 [Dactylonectria macrodidyma]|uniref:Uncharacterized protein n=1 Tax=Dactylonectria macrodidyma TaxID=307937 RepID=A0A9P9DF99_9HYPO|nr:hypothetical protein EDB81DRAFT_238671 [Dactylonectria macrodidyma]
MAIPIHWWLGCGCLLVNSFRWLALVFFSFNQHNMLISTLLITRSAALISSHHSSLVNPCKRSGSAFRRYRPGRFAFTPSPRTSRHRLSHGPARLDPRHLVNAQAKLDRFFIYGDSSSDPIYVE